MYRVRMVALAVLQATVGQREFIVHRGWHLGRQGRRRRRPPPQVRRLTAPYSQRLQNGRFRRHWYVERRCGRVWRRYGRVWRRRRSVSHDATPRGRITTQNMYFSSFCTGRVHRSMRLNGYVAGLWFPVKCAPTDMPCPLTSPSDYAPTAHTPKYIKFHVLFTERPHRPHPTHVGSMRVSPGSGTRRCHTSGHRRARTITT